MKLELDGFKVARNEQKRLAIVLFLGRMNFFGKNEHKLLFAKKLRLKSIYWIKI